ncbi:MAG: thioredoxin domain-containing protein, partial [Dehalococcoidia bacterium]|nr:thioredoxin domain-containing protein [Dehalococcoidia bacterium]
MANRLINESSPYLQQHAHNPVDWYAWGKEAFDRAARENKPVLLSIGYSTCHWCHVMEKESFENEDTARLMNKEFVNIKVDREERPDLDHIYLEAAQAMTGRGGWPLTVFLTPEGVPFYAGTYFPPQDTMGMTGFPKVLITVAGSYHNQHARISEASESIVSYL